MKFTNPKEASHYSFRIDWHRKIKRAEFSINFSRRLIWGSSLNRESTGPARLRAIGAREKKKEFMYARERQVRWNRANWTRRGLSSDASMSSFVLIFRGRRFIANPRLWAINDGIMYTERIRVAWGENILRVYFWSRIFRGGRGGKNRNHNSAAARLRRCRETKRSPTNYSG